MDLQERRRGFKKTGDLDEVRRKREEEDNQVRKSEKADLIAKKRQNTQESLLKTTIISSDDGKPRTDKGKALLKSFFTPVNSSSFSDASGADCGGSGMGIIGASRAEEADGAEGDGSLENSGLENEWNANFGENFGDQNFGDNFGDNQFLDPNFINSNDEKASAQRMKHLDSLREWELAEIVRNNKGQTQYEAIFVIRKHLSRSESPPIDDVINTGIVPTLVHEMLHSAEDRIKFEASWALTNVASGSTNQTKSVIEAGGLEAFISVLNSQSAMKPNICEQCVWGLSNCAGDGLEVRDRVLGLDVMTILQNICTATAQLPWQPSEKISVLRNVMWLMSNLVRGKVSPPYHVIRPCYEVFAEVVGRNLDREMTIDAIWGLSYATTSGISALEDDVRCTALCLAGQGGVPPLVESVIAANTTEAEKQIEGWALRAKTKEPNPESEALTQKLIQSMMSQINPADGNLLIKCLLRFIMWGKAAKNITHVAETPTAEEILASYQNTGREIQKNIEELLGNEPPNPAGNNSSSAGNGNSSSAGNGNGNPFTTGNSSAGNSSSSTTCGAIANSNSSTSALGPEINYAPGGLTATSLSNTTAKSYGEFCNGPDGKVPGHENELLRTPAVRVIGNIVSANDSRMSDICIASGLIPCLMLLLLYPQTVASKHKKEAAWILSNIAAGTKDQVLSLCKRISVKHLNPIDPFPTIHGRDQDYGKTDGKTEEGPFGGARSQSKSTAGGSSSSTSRFDFNVAARTAARIGSNGENGNSTQNPHVDPFNRHEKYYEVDAFDLVKIELSFSQNHLLRKECAWVFSNATSVALQHGVGSFSEVLRDDSGNPVELIDFLVGKGFLEAITKVLNIECSSGREDPRFLLALLDSVENVLTYGDNCMIPNTSGGNAEHAGNSTGSNESMGSMVAMGSTPNNSNENMASNPSSLGGFTAVESASSASNGGVLNGGVLNGLNAMNAVNGGQDDDGEDSISVASTQDLGFSGDGTATSIGHTNRYVDMMEIMGLEDALRNLESSRLETQQRSKVSDDVMAKVLHILDRWFSHTADWDDTWNDFNPGFGNEDDQWSNRYINGSNHNGNDNTNVNSTSMNSDRIGNSFSMNANPSVVVSNSSSMNSDGGWSGGSEGFGANVRTHFNFS